MILGTFPRSLDEKVISVADGEEVTAWLVELVLLQEHQEECLRELVYQHYRELKIEAPTPARITRQIRSACRTFEQQFFETIFAKLPDPARRALERFLGNKGKAKPGVPEVTISQLRQDPGRVSLNTMLEEIAKLRRIRELTLPPDLFTGFARNAAMCSGNLTYYVHKAFSDHYSNCTDERG